MAVELKAFQRIKGDHPVGYALELFDFSLGKKVLKIRLQ
jgi:hypothetical protein